MTIYLTGDEILIAGSIACKKQVSIRDTAQFEANVSRPSTTAFQQETFPTAWDKAAALLHSFATTQTLVDGNKRTAWASAWLFLRLNNAVGSLQKEVNADYAERFVEAIAAGQKDIVEIADGLRSLVRSQLGNSGSFPDGFQLTSPLVEIGHWLIGTGGLPDGTALVYAYTTSTNGTPSEIVFTLEEARTFAEALMSVQEAKVTVERTIKVPISGILHHQDIHSLPHGL